MNIVLTIVLAVLGSSGVSTVVVALLQRHWQKKDREDTRIDALVSAQQTLMIDRVRHLGQKYIEAGRIALPEKENIHAMYKAYKALGGNGHLETVMSEIDRLDVR